MAKERRLLVIDNRTGKGKVEFPDILWRKVRKLQMKRMQRAVEQSLLPALQKLEQLSVGDAQDAKPKLVGRGLAEIEKDDVAVEAGLTLFQLAVAQGFIEFRHKGKPMAKGNEVPKGLVGACGLSVQEVQHHYLHLATQVIMEKGQKGKAKGILQERIQELTAPTAAHLPKVRRLAALHPRSLAELNQGMSGRLDALLNLDDKYLLMLSKVHPVHVLRGLRLALKKQFPKFLEWPEEKIRAVARVNHVAKIAAMGDFLQLIEDPEVILALGTWPVKEIPPEKGGKNKQPTYETRIAQVMVEMGRDFETVINSSPKVIVDMGKWTNQQIKAMQAYLPYLGPSSAEYLTVLPFDMRISMLEGLWYKLGRDFVEHELENEGGASVVRNVVNQLKEMTQRGSAPKDLKAVIQNTDMFDGCMRRYLR